MHSNFMNTKTFYSVILTDDAVALATDVIVGVWFDVAVDNADAAVATC